MRSVPEALQVSVSVITGDVGDTDTALMVGLVFCTVAVVLDVSPSPEGSVVVTVHVTTSLTSTMLGVNVSCALLPIAVPPTLHSYVVVRESPSRSEVDEEHVIVLSAYGAVSSMEIESTLGAVFSITTVSEEVTLAESESVAVTVHTIESPTLLSLADTV